MQRHYFCKGHTWGIVGAGFLAYYAPHNLQDINVINPKGVEGHSFFAFSVSGKTHSYMILPDNDLFTVANVDTLCGGLGGETATIEVEPAGSLSFEV